MNIVDLLVTIIVVTILVTIILSIITYIAYKLRLSREPSRLEELRGPQYFVPYVSPAAAAGSPASVSALSPLTRDSESPEKHAAEA